MSLSSSNSNSSLPNMTYIEKSDSYGSSVANSERDLVSSSSSHSRPSTYSRHFLKRSQTGPHLVSSSLTGFVVGLPSRVSSTKSVSRVAQVRSVSGDAENLAQLGKHSSPRYSLPAQITRNLIVLPSRGSGEHLSDDGHSSYDTAAEDLEMRRRVSFSRSSSASTENNGECSVISNNTEVMALPQDENYKVLEFLWCGTVDAIQNGEWLCRNHIAYLVNLIGEDGRKVKRRPRKLCQCTDNSRFHDLLKEIPVKIALTADVNAIYEKFSLVNAFITEARAKGVQVLLYNEDEEQDYSQAFAIQYMMYYHKIGLTYAKSHLERSAKLNISTQMDDCLNQWEEHLRFIERKSTTRKSLNMGNSTHLQNAQNGLGTIPEQFAYLNMGSKVAWATKQNK
ncbi:hypothetical protein DdX_11558 [Ditylenchus destructor]|uniref:Uncharacterized protein n=1 Tax=Ditylenchus destructor TaxID=166010 RepID=A0AAD4MYY4_9BILA|nr:hypothetical protein DdX_11558 [Ditylenchus destructor]